MTTGRLITKIGGQENEVERTFDAGKQMGMTMQAFKAQTEPRLNETLKTAKMTGKNSDDDKTTKTKAYGDEAPAQAYDRNPSNKPYKPSSTAVETEEIEFCTPNATYENLDNYIIGKRIGQGAYAVVRLGLHKELN